MAVAISGLGGTRDSRLGLGRGPKVDAAVWFAGANAVALGLILLLAGLRDVPLLTSARARGGAWTKLAGANLLILCFAFVGLEDSTVIGRTLSETWIAGDTPNLWWEIDQAIIAVPRQRIVLVCLGNEERLAAFVERSVNDSARLD